MTYTMAAMTTTGEWRTGRHGALIMMGPMGPIRTPKIYTTTGFGPGKNREIPGVDHLVVCMQTAVKYTSL